MKKRFLALSLLLAMMTMMCCGCDRKNAASNTEAVSVVGGNFDTIADSDVLVYDKDTLMVYYLISYRGTSSSAGFGYMSPYINENGNFCRYIDGQIVEIVK